MCACVRKTTLSYDFFGSVAELLQAFGRFIEGISGTITAVATLALAALTWVLARATNAMAKATSSSNVVASLEVNQWSFRHLDLVVQNTGNAAAFDTTVTFTPPLPFRSKVEVNDAPFGKVSILRPGQVLVSNVNDFQSVSQSVYRVRIEWKRTPTSKRCESNVYDINMAAIGKISRLGAGSPEVQVAEQIKKLREDWGPVAHGQRRIKTDQFSSHDREHERDEQNEMWREFEEQQAPAPDSIP